MNAADVIRGALDLIPDEDHWYRGPNTQARNRTCVLLAMSATAESNESYFAAMRLVADEAGVTNWASGIPAWNDDPHTSFEDMRLVLKRALWRAEEFS